MVVHLLGEIYHCFLLQYVPHYLPTREETIKHEKYKTTKKEKILRIQKQKHY